MNFMCSLFGHPSDKAEYKGFGQVEVVQKKNNGGIPLRGNFHVWRCGVCLEDFVGLAPEEVGA